jgi:Uma2 family endonuclease
MRMSTIVIQDTVRIPTVGDLESFRAWTRSEDFPERGRYSFLKGELWVDLTPEQLFTHNDVKMEYASVIRGLLRKSRRGRFFGDRTLLTNVDAGLSTEPDGLVVLFESLKSQRVRLMEGADEGFVEISGTPDLVLEVVSATSVQKDTVVLRDLYWQAKVTEYWLVDVRGSRSSFDILTRTRDGYAVTRRRAGWVASAVLGHAFRLSSQSDATGNPEFRLAVK